MASLQIVSDLHLESPRSSYEVFEIPPKAPYLALLGDVGYLVHHEEEYLGFLRRHLAKFRVIFLVLGNHEPWHSSWEESQPDLGELVILDRDKYRIETPSGKSIRVLGCTLFSHVPPSAAEAVSFGVNDFYYTENWSVEQHNSAFARDLAWLNSEVAALEAEAADLEAEIAISVVKVAVMGPEVAAILEADAPGWTETKDETVVVVLTHFSPTRDVRASDPQHRASRITSAFATDLRDATCWRSPAVKLWAFGHTHYNCDFVDDDTGMRVVANQRGYYGSQVQPFADKVVEIV
ncbi:Ser/Thr protein phosphatase superfamily [Nemania sp. FL0916]|nr:Ser/Thr protein phosphatase superfamily [Nemania sp. FL0916]